MQDPAPGFQEIEELTAAQGTYDTWTRDMADALDQKTALIHEIDHRVKNNLQLIASLLLLQARRAQDPAVKSALKAAHERINAVATVHRRLFQGDDVTRFELADFLRDLVADIIGMSGRHDIRIMLTLVSCHLPTNQAAPLALLISELVGNAVHHAFPNGRPGLISIVTAREGAVLRIEIADDGVGMDDADANPGFGQTIVKLLSQQVRARYETTSANPGVRTVIRLPLNGAP